MTDYVSAARAAADVLRPHLPITRLLEMRSRIAGNARVFLKLESDLPTGSFKPRGALYALATNMRRRPLTHVVACSTGNHGAAVAFAARSLGIPATIILPTNPNPVKRARIESLGATIVEHGDPDLEAARAKALEMSRGGDVYFLNDATDPDLPNGVGTMSLELFDQLQSIDVIVVPIGDSALIRGVAGVAKQLSPSVRVVGVQAEGAPSYHLSFRENRAVTTDDCETIADGLSTRVAFPENVRTVAELVDDIVLVSDQDMLDAMRHLLLEEQVVAEPSGAAATAAVMRGLVGDVGKGNVVALVTGSNVPPAILRRAICG